MRTYRFVLCVPFPNNEYCDKSAEKKERNRTADGCAFLMSCARNRKTITTLARRKLKNLTFARAVVSGVA